MKTIANAFPLIYQERINIMQTAFLIFCCLLTGIPLFSGDNPGNKPLDISDLMNADLVKVEVQSLHGSYRGKKFYDILEKSHFNDPVYQKAKIKILKQFPKPSDKDIDMWKKALNHYQSYINRKFYNPDFKGYSDLSNYKNNLRLSFNQSEKKWVLYYMEDGGPSADYAIWITMDEEGRLIEEKEYFMPKGANY